MTTSTFNRRSLLAALAATPFAAPAMAQSSGLSANDRALVATATTYLEGLAQARARFVQTDARGGTTQGTVFLKRPGKARFAYDPPSGLLVVSDGGVVSVQDKRLKTFDKYPLSMTPLSLFLARNIRLDRGVTITRVTRDAAGFTIIARDGKKQAAGQIALSFSSAPLTLTGWAVTDAQNRTTRVRLNGLERVSSLDPALFILKDPRPQGVGRARM